MRYRLTIMSAIAVVAASFSLFAVISGAGWFYAGIGAVIVVGGAGLATRLAGIAAAAAATGVMLIAVMPLLTGPAWAGRIGGVALVAAMAGSALTRRLLPALADAGTYLAGAVPLPEPGVRAPAVVGLDRAHRFRRCGTCCTSPRSATPSMSTRRRCRGVPGLELIAAAGIGVIAIATDLIAVRLRSPAVAGLPLLVLFAVPVATNVKDDGVGLTLAFCLGITGYLALLAAEGRERLRLWGRLVTVWQDTPDDEDSRGPDTRALAASGRRIGLTAVAVAVIVPLALPRLQPARAVRQGRGAGQRRGRAAGHRPRPAGGDAHPAEPRDAGAGADLPHHRRRPAPAVPADVRAELRLRDRPVGAAGPGRQHGGGQPECCARRRAWPRRPTSPSPAPPSP